MVAFASRSAGLECSAGPPVSFILFFGANRKGLQSARTKAAGVAVGKVDKIIGKRIDQFTVDSFIAEGAMGMVFKAHDSTLDRVVALKLIPKDVRSASDAETLQREEAKKRLVHEAQTAGNLVHPNIVTIHSYGETKEFQYICMEYIQGKTLSQILKERGAIDAEEAIPIVEQILMAIEIADKAGIVHRDIKPSNIMITEDNRVKVMDFGIAKRLSLSLTVTGMVLGTPFYMSPEQISGKKVDIRSDIFSLGAVFYELVTGDKPFEADSTATLVYKIIQTDPVPPNIVNVNIPQAVARIIFKAMAKDPSQRYQKPAEMRMDLKALASGALAGSQAAMESQPSFDRTMLADQTESFAAEIGRVTVPHALPSGQQIEAAGPKEEAEPRGEEIRRDLREAPKRAPNIPALILLMLLVVVAGGAAWWHFKSTPAQIEKPAVQPPAALPAPTQPKVPRPGPGLDQRQPSAQALLVEAQKKVISNPHEAQKLLEEALTLEPNNYDCLLALARLLVLRNDDPSAAIQKYKQALSLNAGVSEVHYELGNVYMGQAAFDMAILSFQDCLRLNPRNRDEVLANIGACYMKKGDMLEAKHFFKMALEANPDNAAAKSYMASVTTTTTTPSSPHGGAARQFHAWHYLFDKQSDSEEAETSGKTPTRSTEAKLEGNYTLEGTNLDGARYSGTAGITRSGSGYSVTWKIANKSYTGSGALSGKTLTINRKGPGAFEGVVTYKLGANGMLKGAWGSGKGKETLKLVN